MSKLGYLITALMIASTSINAQEKIHYTGSEWADPSAHDGRLTPVVGVHNIQVMRANREKPSAANGNGWTYNHQPNSTFSILPTLWENTFRHHIRC